MNLPPEGFKLIFDALNDPVYLYDPSKRLFVSANQAGLQRHEASSLIELGKRMFNLPSPFSQKEALRWIDRCMTEGLQVVEWLCEKKSGGFFWEELRFQPVRMGNSSHVLISGIDITQRKRSEDDLKRQSELSQLVATLSTRFVNLKPEELDYEINLALTASGRTLHIDRTSLFLTSEDMTFFSKTHEWCAPGIRPEIQNFKEILFDSLPVLKETLLAGKLFLSESIRNLPARARLERNLYQKQSIKSLVYIPLVYRDTLKGFLGCEALSAERVWAPYELNLLRQISEILVGALQRRQADDALRLSEERNRSVIFSMTEGVLVHNAAGKIIACNQSACDIFDTTQDRLLGLTPEDWRITLIRDDGSPLPPTAHPVMTTLLDGRPCIGQIMGIVLPDQQIRWISVNSQPIASLSPGRNFGAVATFTDITQRRKVEAMLAREARLMALRNQISPHFLFNTLNAIRAVIAPDNDQAREMISHLSDYLRYSLHEGEQRFVELGLELEAMLSYLSIEKARFGEDVQFEYNVQPEAEKFMLPPFLLQPLVENAVKYGKRTSPKPLVVSIYAWLADGQFCLEVRNTGHWLEKHDMTSNKIALQNIHDRLLVCYGEGARFEIYSENGLVRAIITIDTTQPHEGQT